MSAAVPYVTLKEVAHLTVCLSESHKRLNFHDAIDPFALLDRKCYYMILLWLSLIVRETFFSLFN